ncbi:hypothetical protein [Actinorhabdospora filicis]|uniref:hypothetical protein n=1 Tax=Actinorhabdospora filicis TaxID=1785913 RepID=UPI0025567E35|nr:hypothetical protein [Actinorhabdospora filicis]
MLLESTTWLAERRNSFAHQFIDEAGIPGVAAGRLDFTDDAVEEAFHRVGRSAMILADGWEAHLRRLGRPARASAGHG